MKRLVFLFLFLLISFVPGLGQQKLPDTYIKLMYRGRAPVSKPIPEVFLSTKVIVLEKIWWWFSYKINKRDYLKIKNLIENSGYTQQIDTSSIGYYEFLIVTPKATRLYEAVNKAEVEKIFFDILENISRRARKNIKDRFDEIASRIE